MATSAALRGWGSAPVPRTQIVTLRRSDGVVLPVHKDIAELVRVLCDVTEFRGYNLKPGQCWGYAPRYVRGSTTIWSNHAWGLAVDLNAPSNPMVVGPVVTDMPRWMPELWESYGFRWGGNYPTLRKDAMHYEFMGTPQQAAQFTADIKASRPTIKRGAKGESVRLLQRRLNARKFPVTVDGVFGPRTDSVVRAFQKAHRLVVDGIVGPKTWGALG